jgi:hypothetical protein
MFVAVLFVQRRADQPVLVFTIARIHTYCEIINHYILGVVEGEDTAHVFSILQS